MTGNGLIDEYLQHMEDLDRAESSRAHYAEILARMDRELPAGLISAHTDELRDWINAGERKNSTREHYRSIAACFFEWATDPVDPRLDFNPAALLAHLKVNQRRPRPVTNDTLRAVLAQAGEPFRLWFLIAAYAGLRCIELAALERSHITEEAIWVCGKGGEERYVPTHPLIWPEVRDLSGRIIRRLDGQPASRRYVSGRGNNQLHNVLGVSLTMHHLRRWFLTASYGVERDILATQRLAGHAQVTTTQIYVDTAMEDMARTVASLPLVA